jgi:hypothetical protein
VKELGAPFSSVELAVFFELQGEEDAEGPVEKLRG